MNCDQTLAALAAGSALRRLRARRHAVRCPRCRETVVFHDEVVATLAVHPPLTAEQHAIWLRAADAPPVAPSSTRRRSPRWSVTWTAALGSAAAAATLAFLATRESPPPPEGRAVVDAPSQRPVVTPVAPDPALRLDAMRSELEEIEQELALLARKAELLDSRAEAEVLWTQFAPVDESRTL